MMYVALVLFVLVGFFAVTTLKWMRDNPLDPLNHVMEPRYERPRYTAPVTNMHQMFAATATSSWAYVSDPQRFYHPIVDHLRGIDQ